MSQTVVVSNGREFYRIPLEDLTEAELDGFYLPEQRRLTIVSDGDELFEIPMVDLEEARHEGFRDLLSEERATVQRILAKRDGNGIPSNDHQNGFDEQSAAQAARNAESGSPDEASEFVFDLPRNDDSLAAAIDRQETMAAPYGKPPVITEAMDDSSVFGDGSITPTVPVDMVGETSEVADPPADEPREEQSFEDERLEEEEESFEDVGEAVREPVSVRSSVSADGNSDLLAGLDINGEEPLTRPRRAFEMIWPESGANRIRMLKVFFINMLLHGAVLCVMALIILPSSDLEDFDLISALIKTDDLEELEELEPVVVEKPKEIKEPVEVAEVVNDLLKETDEIVDLDIDDLDLGMTESETEAPGPSVPITGALGGRSEAGRSAMVNRYGGTAESEAAVLAGLNWLSNHQSQDGSWSYDHRHPDCNGECTDHGSMGKSQMGATGMAILAMLGAGNTMAEGNFSLQTRRGMEFLLLNSRMTPSGLDLRGTAEGNSGMYIQGIATTALCELLAMNEARLKGIRENSAERRKKRDLSRILTQLNSRLRPMAQGAVNFIANAQNSTNGSWGYTPGSAGDTSVVGWQLMALTSAFSANVPFEPRVPLGVNRFLNLVQSDGGAKYGYRDSNPKPSTTSIGLLSRMYLGWGRDHEGLKKGIAYLASQGPSRNNMYYNYYATQVMHHYGGEPWEKWNKVMRDQLVKTQIRQGHAMGSWDLADPHGRAGGRLYMTCLATMTLEVYYRHLPLYNHDGSESLGKQ